MELDSNQIDALLPHRYPFALVARITDYEPGAWARGIKCVSVNEPFSVSYTHLTLPTICSV